MRPRLLHLVLVALALISVQLLLQNFVDVAWVQRVPQRLFALAAIVLAMRAFDPEDRPRRAWMILAIAPVCGIAAGPLVDLGANVGGIPLGAVVIVLANCCWVTAVALLLVILRGTGLAMPWNRRWVMGAIAVGMVSVGMMVPTFAALPAEGPSDLAEWAWSVRRVVGVGADAVVLMLAFLIIRVVLPMRGGRVAGPYLLVASGSACMLATGVGLALGGEVLAQALGTGQRLLDVMGWTFIGAGAFLQRDVVTSVARVVRDDPPPAEAVDELDLAA